MGLKITKEMFPGFCVSQGLPHPTQEFVFHPTRKWALDFAWIDRKIALEVDGSIHGTGKPCPVCKRRRPGGHSSYEGIRRDQEKSNAAMELGWRVFRCIPKEVEDGSVVELLKRVLL